MFRPPFAWREFLLQSWFVARVSVLPTLMLAIPFTVLLVFTFNILLIEFGAADFSGTGAAIGTVNQIGPIVTVLVVAGAGATAMCADLGARTIREELDALRVMGDQPDPGAGRASGAGGHHGGFGAVRAGDPGRSDRRLLFLRVPPARHPWRVRGGPDAAHRHRPTSSSRWSRRRCSGWPPA